jgi:lipooligosaccharide transport system permease protein
MSSSSSPDAISVTEPGTGVAPTPWARPGGWLPELSWRWLTVWRRNALVWRKMWAASVLGNLADPLIYMVGLGYGLGALVPMIDGAPYVAFLAAGTVCYSTMNAATFETLYSAFSRMHVQKTWEALLNAPLSLDDVLLGELVWAATKSLLSGLAILLVIWVLGLSSGGLSLWVLPVIFVVGLSFSALGLIMNALAPGYDFFTYYFTLFVTPMSLISGVFFPLDQLPAAVRIVAEALPLSHGVALVRPLLKGQVPEAVGWHLLVLLATTVVAFLVARWLTRRRLLR